ncbi:MAG: hypothetical protein ACJASF_000920 [Vicingaceae bacterium]|jgi:hypothetical protein
MKRYLFIPLFLIASVSSWAQTTSTISAGNWSTAGNWSNGVPGGNDNVTVGHVMTLDTDLLIKGTFTVSDLGEIVDSAGGGSFNINVQNSGILDVSGNLLIEGNLIVRNFAQFILRGCDTMTVEGDVFFTQTATVTIERCAVLFIDGNLDISNSNGMTIDGDVVVGGSLTTKNSAAIVGLGRIQIDGITDILNTSTVFGSTTGCNPGPCSYGAEGSLPIELLSFSAVLLSETEIEINWETLTELNNDFFTLDYSLDGENFNRIANIQGAGNSTTIKKYRHIFEHDLSDVIYLRLTQTDYDGKFESFQHVAISPMLGNENLRLQKLKITAFPNPSQEGDINLIVKVNGNSSQNSTLLIQNLDGALIFQHIYTSEELSNGVRIDDNRVLSLSKGIYIISVLNGEQKSTEKYIVI